MITLKINCTGVLSNQDSRWDVFVLCPNLNYLARFGQYEEVILLRTYKLYIYLNISVGILYSYAHYIGNAAYINKSLQ